MDNDIVPGGTITMRVWRQDGWGHLVAAAAKGDTMKVDSIASVNGWGAVCRNAGSVLLKTFECFYQVRVHREKSRVVLNGRDNC